MCMLANLLFLITGIVTCICGSKVLNKLLWEWIMQFVKYSTKPCVTQIVHGAITMIYQTTAQYIHIYMYVIYEYIRTCKSW